MADQNSSDLLTPPLPPIPAPQAPAASPVQTGYSTATSIPSLNPQNNAALSPEPFSQIPMSSAPKGPLFEDPDQIKVAGPV